MMLTKDEELKLLDNYGYNRDRDNNCVSSSIEEDIKWFLSEKGEEGKYENYTSKQYLHYLALYLGGSLGDTEYYRRDLESVKRFLKRKDSITKIDFLQRVDHYVANAIYVDSVKHFPHYLISRAVGNSPEILLEDYDEIMMILEDSIKD